VLTAVHASPMIAGISLVEKKDRKNAAATSGARPTLGESAAANPSRTPNPPMVMEIRFDNVTTGRMNTACQSDRLDADDEAHQQEVAGKEMGDGQHPIDRRGRDDGAEQSVELRHFA
jgi:hypothetical protein